jgi:hypothetical protein
MAPLPLWSFGLVATAPPLYLRHTHWCFFFALVLVFGHGFGLRFLLFVGFNKLKKKDTS